MANDCLVTKLKSNVVNDNLLKLGEYTIMVNAPETANANYRFIYAVSGNKVFRGVTSNVKLSTDGSTWSDSITVNATADRGFNVWIKTTDGQYGTVAMSDKYNLALPGRIEVADCLITHTDITYLKSLSSFVVNASDKQPFDLTLFPNLSQFTIAELHSADMIVKRSFKATYDRTKKPDVLSLASLFDVYFDDISECINYLEDCTGFKGTQSRFRILYNADMTMVSGIKVPLDDNRISAYKTRFYNVLVKFLTQSPFNLASCQLFNVTYTYSNGNLLGDGEIVTP